MKMYFFRGASPNFGDELNTWLLPKVFPDLFDEDERQMFLGIGSILFDDHPPTSQKIVFGSGYAGYTKLPKFDESWRIYCVRGPHTARACNLNPEKVAADTAILIARFRCKNNNPTNGCSFMPHWASVGRGHWAQVSKMAGIHYIDPTKPVEEVLADIQSSKMLITEAMHGAVVADALRVPWIAALPFHVSHRMKWFDWAEALDIKVSHYKIWPSSLREARSAQTQADALRLKNPSGYLKTGMRAIDWGFTYFAAAQLTRIRKQEPTLSPDASLIRALSRLEDNAAIIRRDFCAA